MGKKIRNAEKINSNPPNPSFLEAPEFLMFFFPGAAGASPFSQWELHSLCPGMDPARPGNLGWIWERECSELWEIWDLLQLHCGFFPGIPPLPGDFLGAGSAAGS